MINKLLRNYRIKNTIASVMVLFVIISSSINSYVSYTNYKHIQYETIKQKLRTALLSAKILLGDEFFSRAKDANAISKKEDAKNIVTLSELAESLDLAYIYTMIKRDGKIYFTSSSATQEDVDLSQVTKYFDEYEEATPLLLHLLEKNEEALENSIDKWGNFKTLFKPYKTLNGDEYIIGADIKVDDISNMLDDYLKRIFILQMIVVGILILLSFYFVKISRKELSEIKFIKENLDKEIIKKTKELADLNNSLEEKIRSEVEKNRQKEQFMLQQSRLAQMGEMLSMIAHQWRQPLSAITAATGVLIIKAKRDKLEAQTALEVATRIKDFSFHLSSTIDDFRNFFKTDKKVVKTSLDKIAQSVRMIVGSSLKQHDIKCIHQIGDIIEIEAYESEIKQVLLNLIKNAEDALLENEVKDAKIIIKIDKNVLSVSDNAGGIPEDIMDKIFEPYFSTKIKKDGTGLGLYMSKLIVEDHCNGKLDVKNNNEGACFTMSLEMKNG